MGIPLNLESEATSSIQPHSLHPYNAISQPQFPRGPKKAAHSSQATCFSHSHPAKEKERLSIASKSPETYSTWLVRSRARRWASPGGQRKECANWLHPCGAAGLESILLIMVPRQEMGLLGRAPVSWADQQMSTWFMVLEPLNLFIVKTHVNTLIE